ncbi:MAG TPA: hypothetical protein VMF66_20955 [Candidatus Acidoferrum sp.]|nr:hypothetical protein [Candidatus Acidoferrum sp.]
MRYFLIVLGAVCLTGFVPRAAQAQVELFGGYSYMRPSVPLTTAVCPGLGLCSTSTSTDHPNLNGWELTGVYNAYHWIGVAADFTGEYGSVDGLSTHINTYLFGPQVRLHTPVSPFAHALFGVAHETVAGTESSAFAAAVGAGIDIRVAPFVSFRPIQLDYLVTRFGSGTQSQPRASAGIMLHF